MENNDSIKQPALGVVYAFCFIASAILLLLIPVATDTGPPDQGWWTQPALMPSIALSIMVISAAYLLGQHLYQLRKDSSLNSTNRLVSRELLEWLRPLEYFIYYYGYIQLLGYIGYFLASLVFIVVLCLRTGLRSGRWMFIALLSALALLALFRWGLNVWMPISDLYGLLPDGIREMLNEERFRFRGQYFF